MTTPREGEVGSADSVAMADEHVALAAFSPLAINLNAPDDAVAAGPQADEDTWWVQPSLALWLPGLDGKIGARGRSVNVSASFINVLQDSDSLIGITGSFSVGKGRWSGFVNGYYADIGSSLTDPGGRIDITTTQAILGFGISYEVGRWTMEDTKDPNGLARHLTLNVFAGGRYNSVENEINFPVLPTVNDTKSWVDPMIGAAMSIPIASNGSLALDGSIGGFGVASDFAWTLAGMFSWDFHISRFPSSLQFGYMAYGDDYETGSGNKKFVWDAVMHGPVLNFQIRF